MEKESVILFELWSGRMKIEGCERWGVQAPNIDESIHIIN
jgi:hypothetical protein